MKFNLDRGYTISLTDKHAEQIFKRITKQQTTVNTLREEMQEAIRDNKLFKAERLRYEIYWRYAKIKRIFRKNGQLK